MNMIDPVPVLAGHLKKIVHEEISDGKEYNQTPNGKRKRSTIMAANNSTTTNTIVSTDTKSNEETVTDTEARNTDVTPNINMTGKMIETTNDTKNEESNQTVTDEDEEGIDHDVFFTSDEDDNIFNDIVQEDTLGYCDSNNELQIIGEKIDTFHFNPLTRSSREEVGPLVQITKFIDIPFTHIGKELRGFLRFREIMEGDGSCYFRAISFAISGKQDYYRQVRETICDYIENFPGRLNAVLNTDHGVQSGREYIKKSEMRKDTTWATEIEILATAKCFRHDVFTFYNYKWQRYSYVKSLSHDAIYLDNRAGNHFDVVLTP